MLVARYASVVIRIRGHRPRYTRPPRTPHSLPRASCANPFTHVLTQASLDSSVRKSLLRREGDSNPRNPFGVYTLSRRASSTTRASLLLAHYTFRPAKVQKIFDIYTIVCDFFLFFHKFITKSDFAAAVVTSFTCSGEQLYTCANRSTTYHIQRLSFRLPR